MKTYPIILICNDQFILDIIPKYDFISTSRQKSSPTEEGITTYYLKPDPIIPTLQYDLVFKYLKPLTYFLCKSDDLLDVEKGLIFKVVHLKYNRIVLLLETISKYLLEQNISPTHEDYRTFRDVLMNNFTEIFDQFTQQIEEGAGLYDREQYSIL